MEKINGKHIAIISSYQGWFGSPRERIWWNCVLPSTIRVVIFQVSQIKYRIGPNLRLLIGLVAVGILTLINQRLSVSEFPPSIMHVSHSSVCLGLSYDHEAKLFWQVQSLLPDQSRTRTNNKVYQRVRGSLLRMTPMDYWCSGFFFLAILEAAHAV